MATLDNALNKYAEFWEVLISLPDSQREQVYTTMAEEINACSERYVVRRREVANA